MIAIAAARPGPIDEGSADDLDWRLTDTVDETLKAEFAAIYSANRDPIYRFCLSQLHDQALSEDVAADVFASAFAAYAARRPADEVAARAWLFRIARNATIDQYRRRSSRTGLLAMLHRNRAPGVDVETTVAARADLRAVLNAVAQLNPRERTVIGLRIAAGLSHAEIAAVMGLKESATKMACHRALLRLRAAVPSDSDSGPLLQVEETR